MEQLILDNVWLPSISPEDALAFEAKYIAVKGNIDDNDIVIICKAITKLMYLA